MKKIQILFGMLAALAWSATALAAPVVVNATTNSSSTSGSIAIGAMGAPVANATSGNSSATSGNSNSSATSGNSNSSATSGNSSATSGNSSATSGNSTSSANGGHGGRSSATGGHGGNSTSSSAGGHGGRSSATGGHGGQGVGSVTLRQHFAASRIPLQAPTVFAPSVPTPEIFGGLNAPTSVKGIPITELYERECNTTATRAHTLKDEHFHRQKYLFGGEFSISGNTDITFSPAQGYYWAQKYPNYKGGVVPPITNPVETESVSIITPAEARTHKYVCLGLLTVVATEKGLPLSSVISDARVFPLGYMEGHRKVALVLLPSTVAAALGVQTSGKSFSLVPSIVHAAATVLTTGGAGASVSAAEGATYAAAKLGMTLLVLAPNKWYGVPFTLVK